MAEILAHELGLTTVEPDGLIGHIAQKAAVMTDQHQRRINLPQRPFQPFNGRQIKMIGRLIQKQHFGLTGHSFGQRNAPPLAA